MKYWLTTKLRTLAAWGIVSIISIHQSMGSAVCQETNLEKEKPEPTVEQNERSLIFEKDIRPFLEKKCVSCHGNSKQSADLNMASGSSLLKGSESGPVLVAGTPEESRLFQAVRDGHMPPEGNPALSDSEVTLLHRWIQEGAKFSNQPGSSVAVTDQQVIPILFLRCVPCHGGRRAEADLDLRTLSGILKGGKSGTVAVPGRPSESRLIQRIHAEEMPPRRQLVSVSVKTVESGELKILEQWIAAGMPKSESGPDTATTEPDRLVADDDRSFWSFQPPQLVSPPILSDADKGLNRIHNPVDQFVVERLKMAGLSLSPEADRRTLIRRLSFDLLGLPPRPEEVTAFVSDTRPDAYEILVEQLLHSPHYGERWGRHWLDAAGYADSEGSQNEDRIRPEMWRYRDYVIRSFNADKPYDRFLHEQLAGDELADYENAGEVTQEIYDNLVATGFLRTAPDRTFANITNFVPDRLEVIADELQILGSSVMGLTLHCARCHTHKFDPIPQRDYYRIAAVFKDAMDEHDWLGPEARRLKFVTTQERSEWEQSEQQISRRVEELQEQVKATSDEEAMKKLQEQIRQTEAQRRPEPMIRALWSRGQPSPTFVLKRGNYLTPGVQVGPGVLSVLTDGKTPFPVQPPWPGATTTGRRLAFAKWLTSENHPLTARVMINRLWKHHFGAGLVKTLANFGKTGEAPSHPELLDWLAREFVRSGWSIRQMHRLMVLSATYRQCSDMTTDRLSKDPENRLLSRMPMRRVEAEIVRDSLLFVSGQLDATQFGPPDDVDVRADGLVTAKGTEKGSRRSIYVLHRRTKLPTILETFDSPQMGPNCIERGESTVAPQALHLLNNAVVYGLAGKFAERVRAEAGDSPEERIFRVHELAFGAAPENDELTAGLDAYHRLLQQWQQKFEDQQQQLTEAPQRALQNYCHAIMNTAAFVYVD